MTSYWNWASVEAEIWSRVSYLPSKFSICSLISLKSEKRIIIYLQWRNERCGLIEVFKTEWPMQPCSLPYIALLLGSVTWLPASFGGLWRHNFFLPADSSRNPWDSYLSPWTSPSRASSALAAVRDRRASSGKEQHSSSGKNEVGTITLLCVQCIGKFYRRSPSWRRITAC